ncbi:MAG: hypothetical protein EXS36_18335 [Pedosphaera sp.]|nr:hypothetical protein [Pedosphaera sp.]
MPPRNAREDAIIPILVVSVLLVLLLYVLLIAACFAIVMLLPESFLGSPVKAVLTWLPPFMRGEALRNWAATTAERLVKERLTEKPTGTTAARLAAGVEVGAMQAMLPTAGSSDLNCIIACPETGQEMVGLTAPEALTIANYLRKNQSRADQ